MKRTWKKAGIILAGALLTVSLTACGSSNKLVGRWEGERNFKELEFFKDGTYKSNYTNYFGSYTAEDGRLRLGGVLVEDLIYDYKISGDTLTLYDDGDVYCELERVD